MGIFTRRGFEFLVRFDKLANVNIEKLKNELMKKFPGAKVDVLTSIQAISIIDQSKTDARLVQTHYYKTIEREWFSTASCMSCINVGDLIPDFVMHEEEKELVNFVLNREDVKDHFVEFGWYDVARVSTTYAV
mmetsp:Transcript_45865/g.74833  ORF Transcript_45865/g.74833 Transcript_45865/m.74833 type:complete len:133 (+) Transcript_45865:359-757(+)|eukprot:CAMPEP_0184644924 /NCGR_PEP_ID=MMETSP0308-20130426/1521_1 /TAXON_ID=38269 /ORGANISM="Gloeochaete witrockiana, Strain SAG 46.84" /LENGTH=132 /DNA_ID=CAMNT_0027073665 /DNA_START=353 /DNA_END=751 /DNA_ORIENTATION=+